MSRVLYPINERDLIHKDILNHIAGFVINEKDTGLDDCIYYTFYHESAGRGHIVMSLKIENEELNFAVKIEGDDIYQIRGDAIERKFNIFGWYVFVSSFQSYSPIHIELSIDEDTFNSIVKKFKESIGHRVQSISTEYLINKCRTKIKKTTKKYYNYCYYFDGRIYYEMSGSIKGKSAQLKISYRLIYDIKFGISDISEFHKTTKISDMPNYTICRIWMKAAILF